MNKIILAKIIKTLKAEPAVRGAYLFGSQVSKTVNQQSDIDIAVYLDKKLNTQQRFAQRLGLINNLSRALKTDKIDLVVINDLEAVYFKYVIIKEGKLLYQQNILERCELEGRIMSEYFDFKPFLDEYNKRYLASFS